MNYDKREWDKTRPSDEWLKQHPDIVICRLCGTTIPKKMVVGGLCPDCYIWQKR